MERRERFAGQTTISWLMKIRDDRAGGVAVMFALLLPVLAIVMALVFDAGYYRWREVVLQSAADAGAMAASMDSANGRTLQSNMVQAADTEAVRNGFMDGNYTWNGTGNVVTSTPAGSIQVNSPPAVTAAYKGQTGYIEVVLTENRPRMFSQIWQGPGIQPITKVAVVSKGGAVAAATSPQNGSGCVMTMDPGGANAMFSQQSTAQQWIHLISPDCEVVNNSNNSIAFQVISPPFLSPSQISMLIWDGYVQKYNGSSFETVVDQSNPNYWSSYAYYFDWKPTYSYWVCNAWASGGAPCVFGATGGSNQLIGNLDPYQKTLAASGVMSSGSAPPCIDIGGMALNVTSGSVNLPSGHYCKGFNISGGQVNLSPGITYVDGHLTMTGGTLNGMNGSTIVLGNGFAATFANANVAMTAPVTGPTAGIIMTEYVDSPLTSAPANPNRRSPTGNSPEFSFPNSAFYSSPGDVVFSSGTLHFTGAIDVPRRLLVLGPNVDTESVPAFNGCTQLISYDMEMDSGTALGNVCAGTGVLPFGSVQRDWATAACYSPVGGMDPNCALLPTGSGSGSSGIRLVQ